MHVRVILAQKPGYLNYAKKIRAFQHIEPDLNLDISVDNAYVAASRS